MKKKSGSWIKVRVWAGLTLDLDEGVGLDDPELGGGHAGEVPRLHNVEELQNILPCNQTVSRFFLNG
jgi:hypothetical protein